MYWWVRQLKIWLKFITYINLQFLQFSVSQESDKTFYLFIMHKPQFKWNVTSNGIVLENLNGNHV